MKTNNLKKVISIIVVSLVLALTVATIVLALVPKKLYNPVTNDKFYMVTVCRDGVENTYIYNEGNTDSEKSKEVCEDLIDLVDKSVQDNLLSSMFQGVLGYENKITNYYHQDIWDIAVKDEVLCLVFQYKTEQKLVINDEVKYTEKTTSSKPITYTTLVMPITDDASFGDYVVYLADSEYKSNYQVKFTAHQKDIYDYIVKLNLSQIKES